MVLCSFWLTSSQPMRTASAITLRCVGMYTVPDRTLPDCIKYRECVLHDKEVRVVDRDGNVTFLLWDRECAKLIGMTSSDLHAKYPKCLNAFPPEILALRGYAMLFRITVRNEQFENLHNAFAVMKIINDCALEFVSDDEVVSPITQQGSTKEFTNSGCGAVKRSLLDEFSSTQSSKKPKEAILLLAAYMGIAKQRHGIDLAASQTYILRGHDSELYDKLKETDGEAAAPAFRLAEQRRSVAKQHQYSDKQSKEIGSEAAPATRQKEEMVLFTGGIDARNGTVHP
nr:replication factor A protein 1-like [Ipomoea batatas]